MSGSDSRTAFRSLLFSFVGINPPTPTVHLHRQVNSEWAKLMLQVPPPITKAPQKAEHGRLRALRQLERRKDNEVWNVPPQETKPVQDARHPCLVVGPKRPRSSPDIDASRSIARNVKVSKPAHDAQYRRFVTGAARPRCLPSFDMSKNIAHKVEGSVKSGHRGLYPSRGGPLVPLRQSGCNFNGIMPRKSIGKSKLHIMQTLETSG